MTKTKLFYPVLIGIIVLIIFSLSLLLLNYSSVNMVKREVPKDSVGFMPEREMKLASATNETFSPQKSLNPIAPEKKSSLKIIKTANIKFRVRNYKQSQVNIAEIIKKYQAYIASENEQNIYDSLENTMSIRVPANKFDLLIESLLKESDYLDYKNIQAQDVTAEFIDNEARLKAKRQVERRYLAILNRADNVKDILEVESQLGQIREEIEATEGQLKYLNDQVNYSTITLVFYQTLNRLPQAENSFFYRLGEAFIKGWNALLSLFVGLIYLWPFLLIIGGGILIYSRMFVKSKTKK